MTTGFSIKMSIDDKTCDLQLRSDEPFTNGTLINRLRDLADQLEEDCDSEEMTQ